MRMPTSESYITGNTPEHRCATVLGLYFFAGTEASGLLTPVVGTLIDHVVFKSTFTVASAMLSIIALICSLFFKINRIQKKYNL